MQTRPCAIAHWHFCPKMMSNFFLQFSLHFGEKIFWQDWRENTQVNVQEERKRKKKNEAEQRRQAEFLSKNDFQFFSSSFSPFWGENFLVGLRRKHLGFTIYFSSSPLNQTHSKKFSFPFSIHIFPSTIFHLQTNTP